jgi:hypothetical protein
VVKEVKMKRVLLQCSVSDRDVDSIVESAKRVLPTWEVSVQEVKQVELTLSNQKVVEEQCKFCRLWSNVEGCRYDAGYPQPVEDCLLLSENRR